MHPIDSNKHYRFRTTLRGKLVLQIGQMMRVNHYTTQMVWRDAKVQDMTTNLKPRITVR